MQRYIGDILNDLRRDSHNVTWSEGDSGRRGTPQRDLVRFANYAQERIQGRISKKFNSYFEVTPKEIDIEAGVDEYSVNDNVYLGSRYSKVEYSRSGEERDYQRLRPVNPYLRMPPAASPCHYLRRGTKIVLLPKPTVAGGKLRVTYERTLDQLALRAGQIQGVTLSGGQLTVLSIDTSTDGDDVVDLDSARWLCISNADGEVQMRNIPITSYDSSTGIVTLPAFTYASGETAAAGDYVTIGKWTTTHSSLVDVFERYISEYVVRRLMCKDSSADYFDVGQEFRDMEMELVDSLITPDKDVARMEFHDLDPIFTGGGFDDGGYF